MRDHGQYQLIGATRDDAAGEAFDKVGRVLGLPYPGGPSIQKAASGQLGASRPGNPKAFALPRAMLRGSDDFSFSGLKTAAQRLITEQAGGNLPSLAASPDVIADLAASVQEAIADMLVTRTLAVAERFAVPNILVAGGVSANTRLRELFRERSSMPVLVPPFAYCTDNAAMIAGNAFFKLQRGQCDALSLDVQPNLRLAPEEF
jgi:N6-L-threonylcarbamoyladenine synthase